MSGISDIVKKPLVVTIVVIVIVIYLISTLMYVFSNTTKHTWPPFGMSCPDFWRSSQASGGFICTPNPVNLNKPIRNVNFQNSTVYPYGGGGQIFSKGNPFQNINGKQQWAQETGVAWDGANSSA